MNPVNDFVVLEVLDNNATIALDDVYDVFDGGGTGFAGV